MPSDDEVVQAALGFERSFSLVQLIDVSGSEKYRAERVIGRLVRSGELSSYKTEQGQTRYEWT